MAPEKDIYGCVKQCSPYLRLCEVVFEEWCFEGDYKIDDESIDF